MKNPLYKRLPRELKAEIGKYIALFLFLTCTIGFVSGFLVSDISLKNTYDESFEKYNIENGHFSLDSKMDNDLQKQLDDLDVTVYPLYYKNVKTDQNHTFRIYKDRKDVNKIDLMDGVIPTKNNQITVDRLYAENNNLKIGSKVKIANKDYNICGITAFSDYSALFNKNSDTMFDANKFNVSIVSDSEFDNIKSGNLVYNYAWTNDDQSMSELDMHHKGLYVKNAVYKTDKMNECVVREENQAITFTGNDMGSDKVMVMAILYIVIVIMAFIFAVTTKSTIEKESSTIGTLMASGYTKKEMLNHYLILPTLTTLVAAVAGNIIGYTAMKTYCASMYYGSYSLTTFKTYWSVEAFIETTVIPCIIVFIVNYFIISKMLNLSPLQFLRKEFKVSKDTTAKKLPNFKFLNRFRIRILTQNKSAYFTLFIGILFACVLLIFGSMMNPLLANCKDQIIDNQIAPYQYVLKSEQKAKDNTAEKYSMYTLKNDIEDIQVIGVSNNSKYFKGIDLPTKENHVAISSSYADKYNIKVGERISLGEKYNNGYYSVCVDSIYDYPSTLSVYLSNDSFNEMFHYEKGHYTGYFSQNKLTDIKSSEIYSVITIDDLTVVADQLVDSMGGIFYIFVVFAVIMFVIIIYLLSKLVIERNAHSISMLKILGYSNKETSKLYNRATAISVFLSLVISMPISYVIIKVLYDYIIVNEMKGYLPLYIAPYIYPCAVLLGMVSYLIIHIIQNRKIKKIPMSQALNTIE